MNPLPPLPALRAFEAVSRLGSVVKAADALSVTHSAISHQLRILEEYLGLPLFERRGRKLILTEDGRHYALQVRIALNDVAEATRSVRARPKPNELTIATLPSFGMAWLLPRLPKFQALYPQYRVILRASLNFEDLQAGQIDLALRMGSGEWDGLKTRELMGDYLVVVAASADHTAPQTVAEVPKARIVGSMEKWSSWTLAAGLGEWTPTFPLFCNDNNLCLQAIRQQQGIGLMRLTMVQEELQAGSLRMIGNVLAPHPSKYWLAWTARMEGSSKVLHFADWIAAEAQLYQLQVDDYLKSIQLTSQR
ncbi:LysR family transcriptional regulator [Chitinibacter bivalviorum]|uniref:LysR family transcriptional regulator n=1 Tax=Chitinibacter bivalviorum TaxID=2739434 RepID=A0A7H9BPB3_9NEIS|nr:LysR substrate-binding domain-containing protein [Chitinibacter bivalviorum]QLG89174.1 LysR family transcriptional regulator [Chitinibacter bivalviorum]